MTDTDAITGQSENPHRADQVVKVAPARSAAAAAASVSDDTPDEAMDRDEQSAVRAVETLAARSREERAGTHLASTPCVDSIADTALSRALGLAERHLERAVALIEDVATAVFPQARDERVVERQASRAEIAKTVFVALDVRGQHTRRRTRGAVTWRPRLDDPHARAAARQFPGDGAADDAGADDDEKERSGREPSCVIHEEPKDVRLQ